MKHCGWPATSLTEIASNAKERIMLYCGVGVLLPPAAAAAAALAEVAAGGLERCVNAVESRQTQGVW